jgi:hypothetical protein
MIVMGREANAGGYELAEESCEKVEFFGRAVVSGVLLEPGGV